LIPILPDLVVRHRQTTDALRRVFRAIRHLDWDDARAWLAFRNDAIDFLLLDNVNRAWLISAADILPGHAEQILTPQLIALDESILRRKIRIESQASALSQFCTGLPVARVIIFPSLTNETAVSLVTAPGVHVHGAGPLTLTPIARQSLTDSPLKQLRAAFTPECRVPPEFLPRIDTAPADDNRSARLTGYLLDFAQETWAKNDLLPSEESGNAAAAKHTRLITGVAGSGKTLALLYRARILASLQREKNLLFTTHNKPLIAELQWRFEALGHILPEEKGVRTEFTHFHRWLGKHSFDDRPVISDLDRIERIHTFTSEMLADSDLRPGFIVDEIAFIADQIDDTEGSYLRLDRTGRGIALDETQRRKVHAIYRRYRTSLAAGRQTDWFFKVRSIWEKICNQQINLPRYHYIIVDEAQFFAPLWFAILKKCLHPDGGQFLISADPTQGFLKRRQSWKSIGLDIRGRSTRLAHSYRNTPALQSFARRFYISRNPDTDPESEEISLPNIILPIFETGGPEFIQHRAPQDTIAYIADEVSAAISKGLRPENILILHEERRLLESIRDAINERLGPTTARLLEFNDPVRNAVALATLNNATGIERSIVFLSGIDSLFGKEDSPLLDVREKSDLIRDHTRKIYMALTRPGEKLIICYQKTKTKHTLEGN
jgi:superfamily I DNA/RNA helicase